MSDRRPLSTMAWVVMSRAKPDNGLERVDDVIVSIHANMHAANAVAATMKRDVFKSLGEDLNPFDHWIKRQLDYRDSIHVRQCDLREVING